MGRFLGSGVGPASAEGRAARRFEAALVVVAALAFACKLWLALGTYGTNDVYAYERFASWSRYLGSGIYAAAWDMNHPPSMIPVLRSLDWLAESTALFFPFWLRLLPSLADAGTLWLVYRLLEAQRAESKTRAGLLLLAGSPALVLISGFHGNTDSLMIFFLMLSVYWTDRGGKDSLAGAALGLAACIKIVPVIALPVLLLCRPAWKRRVWFAVCAGAVVAVFWLPWMLPDVEKAMAQVLGYRGQYGQWGLSWLGTHFFDRPALPNSLFQSMGAPVLLAVIVGISFWMSRLETKPAAYAQLGVVFGVFLSLSNAFGVQYLAWLPPWAPGLALGAVALHTLASGSFLLVVYNRWADAWPWHLADSNVVGSYNGHADYFQLFCWASVIVFVWCAWERVSRKAGALSELELVPSRLGRAVAGALSLMLILPCVSRVLKDGKPGRVGPAAAVAPILAEQDVRLSSILLRAGRHDDGIAVAGKAIALAPKHAAAWNNLAVGYAGKADWDSAIVSAERAVLLDPSFQLAKNNLAWARQERAKGD